MNSLIERKATGGRRSADEDAGVGPGRRLGRQLTSGGVYLEAHQYVDGFGRDLQGQVNVAAFGKLITATESLSSATIS
ncbi:MAG: hypothetical protein ABIQ99_15955 [Thermoflexales bacterium]